MRISKARAFLQDQPFADGPYTCRGQTETGFQSVLVGLTAEDGTTGWGEAAPLGAFYAEAFPEQIAAGVARLLPEVIGRDATGPTALARHLDLCMLGQPAAKSAIDMAAWDLAARLSGQPLASTLGGIETRSAPLYRSISQDDPDTMAKIALNYVERGYRRLQVKVGADPAEDVARMHAVRAAIPTDIPLYADANGGWLMDQALRFCDQTRDLDYWLEQPCMSFDENLAIARHCAKPMVLDEGICTLSDLMRAHQAGMIAGVTLKIARLGGVGPARLLRDVAVALGLKVTIEDTGGSTIDTAATMHLMASTPVTHIAHTVDFMNWVTVQNADGMPDATRGQLHLPQGPGLGVTVDAAAFGPTFAEAG